MSYDIRFKVPVAGVDGLWVNVGNCDANITWNVRKIIELSTGLDWKSAYFVDGCKERNGHLYRNSEQLDRDGLVDNLYYCEQYQGYIEDDFYGTVYFKTNVPGQFVAVPFSM